MKTIVITLVLVFSFFNKGACQSEEVDMVTFIKEIQQWKKTGQSMKLIWWIPTEYWEIALSGNPNVTVEGKEDVIRSVENYTILAALDGKVDGQHFSSNELETIRLIDNKKIVHKPLNQDELPEETKKILDILEPTLSNLIGQMGKNMRFYVFPSKDEKGNNIIEITSESNFSIFYNGDSFNWRLPLGSLVSKKVCPIDDERLIGSWKFCPWHGKELLEIIDE